MTWLGKWGLSLFFVMLLAGCSTTPAPRGPLKLTILHTNDHHGRFWPNGDGEYGMAARKTLIDRQRAEIKAAGGEVLLLDGGDVNTGVPESDLQDAEPGDLHPLAFLQVLGDHADEIFQHLQPLLLAELMLFCERGGQVPGRDRLAGFRLG